MNTKIVMTFSSLTLGVTGIILTFAPDIVMSNLHLDTSPASLLLGQVIGALYFAFSMLNWMTKESLIGGIYNRPIAVTNLTHFLIGGLAIGKKLISNSGLPSGTVGSRCSLHRIRTSIYHNLVSASNQLNS